MTAGFFALNRVLCLLASTTVVLTLFAGSAMADSPMVGLILKTEENPFFVRMKEAAHGRADELGIRLRTWAGQYDGDSKAQVEGVHDLISAGAKGILITPSDPAALARVVMAARQAGLSVIALDTRLIRRILPTRPSPPTISGPENW